MVSIITKPMLIIDDRELTNGEVRSLVGTRHFGDIIYKRRPLFEHLLRALPDWAQTTIIRIKSDFDVSILRAKLENCDDNTGVFIIAGRAGFSIDGSLNQLIERLPYAEENFTDTLYQPLLVYLRDGHDLIQHWQEFKSSPLHLWSTPWQSSQRLESFRPIDLGNISNFLLFMSGSTATRHFNQVHIDTYYYTKSSKDKKKMQAEYSFYGLVPERMRPWLIAPFEFNNDGERASYKMIRYYLADAALQWVHGAFEIQTFEPFIERLLFFIADRPRKDISQEQSNQITHELFMAKVERRIQDFLDLDEGKKINHLATSSNQDLDVTHLLQRYHTLFKRFEKSFVSTYSVVGHGDPCLSNILYDQQRYLLKLIDPKGAITEDELWTHPLYDLCKISHSILGDYDFINNGLYNVGFTDVNHLNIHFTGLDHVPLKDIFIKQLQSKGYDLRIIRLGEASLFLSMLPLHIDYPNKVLAFILTAKKILDEVENDKLLR